MSFTRADVLAAGFTTDQADTVDNMDRGGTAGAAGTT
jgi:hypothetical protein